MGMDRQIEGMDARLLLGGAQDGGVRFRRAQDDSAVPVPGTGILDYHTTFLDDLCESSQLGGFDGGPINAAEARQEPLVPFDPMTDLRGVVLLECLHQGP